MSQGRDTNTAHGTEQTAGARGGSNGGLIGSKRPRRVPAVTLVRVFLRIGSTAFGGLGASLALIEAELVEKRRLVTADDLAEALAATKLLPGSTLVQVVAYLGYRLGGWSGSALATAAFIVPSALAMLLLAVLLDAKVAPHGFTTVIHGLSAAVVGLLMASVVRFSRGQLRNPLAIGVALGAFALGLVFHAHAALVVVAAGLVGTLTRAKPGAGDGPGKGGDR